MTLAFLVSEKRPNAVDLDCIVTALDSSSPQDVFLVIGTLHSDNIRNFLENAGFSATFDTGYAFKDGEVKRCEFQALFMEDAVLNGLSSLADVQSSVITRFKPIDFVQLAPQLISEN